MNKIIIPINFQNKPENLIYSYLEPPPQPDEISGIMREEDYPDFRLRAGADHHSKKF